MDQYRSTLFGLGALSWVLLVSQPTRRSELMEKFQKQAKENPSAKAKPEGEHPQSVIYKVYFMIAISYWLQNKYLYSLYKDEYGLDFKTISSLFVTEFATGAVSSAVDGALGDKFGRKTTSVVFCSLFACSFLADIVPIVPVLYLGRVLGGISNSLLFGVFESWVAADFRERKLFLKGCDLYRTFGTMGVVNSVAAIVTALAGDRLVAILGTKKAPFIAGVLLIWQAMQTIWPGWVENYGATGWEEKESEQPSLFTVLRRPSIFSLLVAGTLFEGSMYLFAAFWFQALKSVQTSSGELPYGYIFSCFMASALAASLSFNIVQKKQLLTNANVLAGVLAVSSFVFFKLSTPKSEKSAFTLLCLYGACFGLYWPSMATLKGRLIETGVRAKVYSVLRVPVYLFVTASILLLGQSGDFSKIFSTASMLLSGSFAAVLAASLSTKMP